VHRHVLDAEELWGRSAFQGFLALVQQAIAQGRAPTDDGLALLALRTGYADQPHLTRECVRLTGVSPRVFLAETQQACACGHDHSASFAPVLRAMKFPTSPTASGDSFMAGAGFKPSPCRRARACRGARPCRRGGSLLSSMAYLHQVPVNALKIDRSFISGIAASKESTASSSQAPYQPATSRASSTRAGTGAAR
jgi:AraC-like DNA-binding protein